MRNDDLITKLKELQDYLVKEADEAMVKIDPHNPHKEYYEGAYRAFEISVFTIHNIFGIELPEHWGGNPQSKKQNVP